MLWTVLLLAVVASAQGRAVNITNTWVLPEEGFPVFYHYFKDRISWYEADAVCQFHHANLVTVDTTAQYDAVRAYLKELDITSAVWVGLIRSNPDGDFTWTDYRGLSSDGYWSSAPDARSAPLCAAADPAADYRWEARACGGPTVASFICELPVPQWAQGNEGCMVRALPALTILYLPESASVQLTADCGMAGVKRVQCTGNVKRENLLKDLSCMDEDESLSSSSLSPASNTWPVTTDAISSAHDTSSETTSEDNITTNHDDDNQPITPSSINQNLNTMTEYKLPIQKINRVGLSNTIEKNLDLSNNLQSNYIPKVANDNHLSNEQLEKIEDEKHMQHKMLHEEIARLGNLENIFTQPTDHFVPPLVMAKAKISDDMTVLSLQEKHAQQFAEEHVNKHKQHNQDQVYHLNELNTKLTTEKPPVMTSDKPLVVSLPPLISKDLYKKEKTKSPKKYIEKLADPKSKIIKQNDLKQIVYDKSTELPSVMKDEPVKIAAAPTSTNVLQATSNYNDDDSSMELTVLLKELPVIQKLENQTSFNYSGDVSKLEVIKSDNVNNSGEIKLVDVEATEEPLLTTQKQNEMSTTKPPITTHKVIKISIVPEYHTDATPTVFEITTNVPTTELGGATTITEKELTTESSPGVNKDILTSSLSTSDSNLSATRTTFNDATKLTTEQDSTTKDTVTETATQLYTTNITNNQTDTVATKDAVIIPVTANVTYKESVDSVNADHHEDYDINANSSEPIDDFQSPLLSAANEPLHRPNRSRRPQPPPNRNKFNPFRMLG